MQIFVKTLDGKPLGLEVASTDTVSSLKSRVELREGVPAGIQRLLHGSKQLEDERTLADYGIENESTVQLLLRLRGGNGWGSSVKAKQSNDGPGALVMDSQVFVKTLNGQSLTVDVDLERDTVLDVKKAVKERVNIEPEAQRLVYMGKVMEDTGLLKDYKVANLHTLHLVVRLNGGKGSESRREVCELIDVASVSGSVQYMNNHV